ncbi:CPBP family intramembrane glutamic endopeptidase [Tenacibaculum sp. MEBiC06402]|uniref:CPBP family intramembrane glutamic endopeptidase n=1 Tax=unclassified Tenacibaculum TaxID=2635139 RepID=UPI003B9A0AB9
MKEIITLYKFPEIAVSKYIKYLSITLIFCFLVYFGIGKLNEFIFPNENLNILYDYSYLEHPFLWSILFVAILPPIFEELAFRGYLFNNLLKLISPKSTIIATAFLFALIHISFISIIWIFPFGLFLGYLRKRYNTLWIPMLVHFTHNFVVLILDYYFYNKELTALLFENGL